MKQVIDVTSGHHVLTPNSFYRCYLARDYSYPRSRESEVGLHGGMPCAVRSVDDLPSSGSGKSVEMQSNMLLAQRMCTRLVSISRRVCTEPDFAGLDVPTADQQAAESMMTGT